MDDISYFFCTNLNNKNKETMNFGDAVNRIFFDLLSNKKMEYGSIVNKPHFVCTGSILKLVNEYSIIFGTGFISQNDDLGSNSWTKQTNKIYKEPLKIISVRGPKTRNKLINMGIDCPEIYGDPLILFPLVYQNSVINEIQGTIGIIPHYIDQGNVNVIKLINQLGPKYNIKIIDIVVGIDYKKFIDEILECEYIISSSLHGIIMGIVYKKKTIYVEFSNNVIGNTFKFYDFFESLNIDYKLKNEYDLNLLNNMINYDIKELHKISINMLNVCPFITDKDLLIIKCNEYYQMT